jgi:riboflavin kinase/FMN adenylyltransferase
MKDMKNAVSPLHTFVGKVIHGKGMGRTVGMPTANIDIPQDELLCQTAVPPGVYASRISLPSADGAHTETSTALTNVGMRPTVDDDTRLTVEAHILDFDRDIYGVTVTLDVYYFLRPIQKFPSLQAVMEQVQRDITVTRELV